VLIRTDVPFFLTGVLEDMKLYLSKLLEAEFHREHLKKLLRDFSVEKQLSFSKLMKLLRSAVSGLKVQYSIRMHV
jgi:hypothetical protein